MDENEHQAVAAMDQDTFGSMLDTDAVNTIAPPGEEGYELSHEGGEYKVFCDIANTITFMTGK
jgi:hypothetical protein